MPLFEHEYFERSRSPDGKSLPIRSAAFLQRMGPVLQVVVSVTKEHAEKLAKQAQPVPEAVAGFALIDTGASITAVDEGGLPKAGIGAYRCSYNESCWRDGTAFLLSRANCLSGHTT